MLPAHLNATDTNSFNPQHDVKEIHPYNATRGL
jgi:hypothetical protein